MNLPKACATAVLALASITWAQTPPTPTNNTAPRPRPGADEPAGASLTRVYNVADLVGSTHQYPYTSAIVPPSQAGLSVSLSNIPPGAGQPFNGVNPRPAQPELAHLIESVVAPDSWKDNGGPVGAILPFGDGLVITQLPENHRRIESLLNDLKTEIGLASRVATVRLVWLSATGDDLKKLMKPNAPAGAIDADALAAAPNLVRYEARVSCFSGQTVSVSSGRAKSVVRTSTPVVASDAVGYATDHLLLQSGLVAEITPVVSKDGSATLDVRAEFSDADVSPASAKPDPAGVTHPSGPTDRINALCQQLATTVKLPPNTAVLVGGMTLEPAAKSTANDPQLYLVAEVR